jgi:hypothetical protein
LLEGQGAVTPEQAPERRAFDVLEEHVRARPVEDGAEAADEDRVSEALE